MRVDEVKSEVGRFWDDEVIPTISKYIEIPNQSPLFDPSWRQTGHMAKAVELVRRWVLAQNIAGSRLEVFQDGERTPVLLLEVDGASSDTVLLYGHLDKQPAMIGWEEGLGPWTPVLRDGRLYGRGSSDDGYAIFSVVSAIKALQTQKTPHARLVVLIECCEESGSLDLPYYVEKLADRIGTPSLVVCLDSGCGDYDALWCTTSLRGSIVGNLTVEILREGVHSGDASGVVPSSFRILRILLDRLEEASTGKIIPEWLWVDVPNDRMSEVRRAAEVLGSHMLEHYPFVSGAKPVTNDVVEMILNRTWRPMLAYTGQEGLPDLLQGGNVLRPRTALKLSLRVPPTLEATDLDTRLKKLFESDPPYGARVSFEPEKGGAGWNCPKLAPWLETSINEASRAFFGRDALSFGEGGSIPFMGMLSEKFPEAQFLVTGVLGPHSNAHGPNEFLHIQMGKSLTGCVARVISDHYKRGA
ncbi:MAG: M20 family metallopeptidase [Acidobacteria bacterium]|nr:M20 family metallopeptidase [Acidobacteriota bacterium]